MSGGRYNLASVERALRLLELFEKKGVESLRLSDIADALGVGATVAFRLANVLATAGYLHRESDSKTYRLGVRLFALASRVEPVGLVRQHARQAMTNLVAATGETSLLSTRSGLDTVCIERVEASHFIKVTMEIGKHGPLHAGASGKVLLAHAPEHIVGAVLSTGLKRYTQNTIVCADALRERLGLIRARGYDVSKEELDPGVTAIAAPVHAADKVLACIAVVLPTSRCLSHNQLQEMVSLVKAAAQEACLDGKQSMY